MTRALILAAGEGKRLRPLTENKPKCLAGLMGKSLLERQVSVLNKCNVEDIRIVTGHCSDQIEALGFDVTKNNDFATTNMVESLFTAKSFIGKEGDLIISYGDIVYSEANLKSLLDCGGDIVLMIDLDWKKLWSLRFSNPFDDAETLVINGSGYVTELGQKPKDYDKIHGQYTGLIKVRGDKVNDFIDFYDNLDRDRDYGGKDFLNIYMTDFLQLLINSGWKVGASKVKSGWLEVDSTEDLDLYEKMAKDNRLGDFIDLID